MSDNRLYKHKQESLSNQRNTIVSDLKKNAPICFIFSHFIYDCLTKIEIDSMRFIYVFCIRDATNHIYFQQ